MTNSDFDRLVNAASTKLGTSPEQLKRTIEKNDLTALSKGLSKADREKLRGILQDKELMEKLKGASSPQEVMRILGQK